MKKICANEYEKIHWANQELVLGIDEAGRGPLAGPLVVAGVIFPCDYQNDLIYDSKAISEKLRNELFEIIKHDALAFQIEIRSPEEIDRDNIYRCTQKAMEKIACDSTADFVLTDAMPLTKTNCKYEKLIKGDQKSISIAAASILAKVTRDQIMYEFDLQYPEYGFKNNKGYPTKQHLEAIEKYGITIIHRKSYGPCKKKIQLNLDI